MSLRCVLPAVTSVKPGSGPDGRSKARAKNDAIWARLTVRSGQNRSGLVLQPAVTPSSARRSTWGSHHGLPVTSAKRADRGVGSSPSRILTSQTAMAQRGSGSVGQKRFCPQSVPSMMPRSSSAVIAG